MRQRLRHSARAALCLVFLLALACGLRSVLGGDHAIGVTHGIRLTSTIVMLAAGTLGLIELTRLHLRQATSVETRLVTASALLALGAFFLHLDYVDRQRLSVRIFATAAVAICALWLLSLFASMFRRRPPEDDD